MANAGGAAAGHTANIAQFVQHYLDYLLEDTIHKELLDESLIAQNLEIDATHVSDMRQTIEQTLHFLSLRPKIYKRAGYWSDADVLAFNLAMAAQPLIPNWRSVSARVGSKSVKSCKRYWVYTREVRLQEAQAAFNAAVVQLDHAHNLNNDIMIEQADLVFGAALEARNARQNELVVARQLVAAPPEV